MEFIKELYLKEKHEFEAEERIRFLEALIFRAKQRQKWRLESNTPIKKITEITNFAGELLVKGDDGQDEGGVSQEKVVSVDVEGEKMEKMEKASYLVAEALGLEPNSKGERGSNGKFFHCNICLKRARDPVLTCCGHLFCWSCFYRLPYAYLDAKECPVCLGEVIETNLIPVYGNASASGSGQMESKETDLGIPARPNAPRT